MTLAAFSRNSDLSQLQTKVTRFEVVALFWKLRCIVTSTLNVQPMRVLGPIHGSLVIPVQRAVCDANHMLRE